MDYKKTLNITLSDRDPRAMPQRANLPAREPEIQKRWEEIDLYRLSLEKEAPRGDFILHDGPPYSNGNIHLGHALNKIAKDIIIKYRTMMGYRAPYIPGWDNHGMPIENEVSREFRRKHLRPDKLAMRRRCREYARDWVEKQKGQFRRLGVRGDWDHPYLTMNPDFEARIVKVFSELAEKGYIYRGLKPVLWCAECETALADAEVEYEQHTSNSIYVRFPVSIDPKEVFGRGTDQPADCFAVVWTTTPWTIPANLAIAIHPDAEYVVVDVLGDRYLLAAPLCETVLAAVAPDKPFTEVWRGRGSDLEGTICTHPLFDRPSPIVFASYVTMEDGTGLVHTAPGHGKDDFETGQRYGLDVLCPVDMSGHLTMDAGEQFQGASILTGEADMLVMEALRDAGCLLAHHKFDHSYPHCWRCHKPLLFRATVQWFMSIDHDGLRQRALSAIDATHWYPPVSKNRISAMVSGRPDWCLSRQRAWGVGIPAFYCRTCGGEVLTGPAMEAVHELVAREGSDAWFVRPADEILPKGFTCPKCGGTEFDKESDILDVWFDSGSTHLAVLDSGVWPNLRWPADVYLEGSDQHRGWFNSSLMVSTATRGRAPYNAVVTNGFTVDENGKKMSKSLGNTIDPLKVIEKYGADILRLWVASTDYFEDVRCADSIVSQASEAYRRIRNTFRFLVNNLYDFDPQADSVPYANMIDLDRWALAELDRVVSACAAGYESYEFHRVFQAVHTYCAVSLSAFYLDVIKDRLYCSGGASVERRSAQTAMHTIAETLARLLAPILSHTAEEVWSHLQIPGKALSPQLADFPQAAPDRHRLVIERWAPILVLREKVSLAVEEARQAKRIGNPLEARVELSVDARLRAILDDCMELLPAVFKVSQVELKPALPEGTPETITVVKAPGTRCARCWLVLEDVGKRADSPDICCRCADVVASVVTE